jgi:ribosomal protein S18 acetylase RimI-like enzyme
MATADILVRPARPDDADALVAILYDTFESTWRPKISAGAAQAYLTEGRAAFYVAERGPEFWIAERVGKVVGLVHWSDDFVHALHVRSTAARKGVGGQLMNRAEAEIEMAGFSAARLEADTFNQISQAFYRARGYREAGRYPDEEWGSGLTTLLLVKTLDGPAAISD